MATVGDWSEAALADYDDVLERYARAYDLTGETVEGNQQTKVTEQIAKAKEHIGNLLTLQMRPKILEMDLDADIEILDYIENPGVFKNAAVAWALMRLFQDNIYRDESYNYSQYELFRAEFKQEFDIAFGLMRFDTDNDGDIGQDEAARPESSTRFYRV